MENIAQKHAVILDESDQQATDELHPKTGGELNQMGFNVTSKELNPHHNPVSELIKDFERIATEAKIRLISGETRINGLGNSEPRELIERRAQDKLKKVA